MPFASSRLCLGSDEILIQIYIKALPVTPQVATVSFAQVCLVEQIEASVGYLMIVLSWNLAGLFHTTQVGYATTQVH
eukprot:1458062-Amphidinium_carterae.1